MPSIWLTLKKKIAVDRLAELRAHHKAICASVKVSRADEREFAFLNELFERYQKKTKRLSDLRIIVAVFILTASFLASILALFPSLSLLVQIVQMLSAALGATSFLVFLALNAKINYNLQTMQTVLMHFAVLYQKNPKRSREEFLRMLAADL